MPSLLVRAALIVAQVLAVALAIDLTTRLIARILDGRLRRHSRRPPLKLLIIVPELVSLNASPKGKS